ncbi:transcription termination factor 3, mitochondrial isoform X2 [Schistocerca gregaria]|uniref:transcription termination factor 3, mitochondrial isoform X2 n=1 Tax=Schistocerca gregaria TaxID=7010 RepID=UPI00211E759F|nr:transcription termination factor 3, mitochondrial isoform X2 [Schistocerca gregaria]
MLKMKGVTSLYRKVYKCIVEQSRCSVCCSQTNDQCLQVTKYTLPFLSRKCFSSAKVEQHTTYDVLNVCDRRNGDTGAEDSPSEVNGETRYPLSNSCTEDLSTYAPYFKPAFNFAAYVNKSPTLQQLVKLGVDLHRIEKSRNSPEYILQLDFERDMSKHIRFLHDVGVPPDALGAFITKNPYIFKENLDDLSTRLNYLQYKKFTADGIARIVTTNPYWLIFSTKRIDRRLGHFQKTYNLSGPELRMLAQKQPKLITYNLHKVKESTFAIKEEMGFSDEEIKKMLLSTPRLWIISQKSLLSRFHFVHNVMKVPHEQIAASSKILTCREFRVRQRHLFLVALNRAQYNPKKESYISLENLVSGTDTEFCDTIAKASVQTYNEFLKTLC